jgi:hypothetical protein
MIWKTTLLQSSVLSKFWKSGESHAQH